MASKKEIEKIRDYASKGYSVNQIKDILEVPKSTVYYHFKKEVGQKQKENAIEIPDDPEAKGEICGVFAGDGSYFYDKKKYEHRIKITLNAEDDYWKILSNYLENTLGKAPHVHHFNSRTILDYSSKSLFEMLDTYLYWESKDKTGTIRLEEKDPRREFKIGFLRGLLDTDGYMAPNYRRYNVTSISKNLIQDLSRILDELGIENKIRAYEDQRENHRKTYFLQVLGNSAVKLNDEIKPRNPKRKCKLDLL